MELPAESCIEPKNKRVELHIDHSCFDRYWTNREKLQIPATFYRQVVDSIYGFISDFPGSGIAKRKPKDLAQLGEKKKRQAKPVFSPYLNPNNTF